MASRGQLGAGGRQERTNGPEVVVKIWPLNRVSRQLVMQVVMHRGGQSFASNAETPVFPRFFVMQDVMQDVMQVSMQGVCCMHA